MIYWLKSVKQLMVVAENCGTVSSPKYKNKPQTSKQTNNLSVFFNCKQYAFIAAGNQINLVSKY